MVTVIGVRFSTGGRVYDFDPGDAEIHAGDSVIVETARGTELGTVAKPPHEIPDEMVILPLKPIVRVATENDIRKKEEFSAKEGKAFSTCEEKIKKHELDMKLVRAEYAFDGSKLVFYFTADDRVDFRELVKDLASEFKTRIELRQIGVRDEARMLGGLGSCGRPVCCNSFLDEFRPVSIKMAKEQNLSLSPTKISGLCGRLMCCLQYEQAAYDHMKGKMPKVGKPVITPDGTGTVMENNAITEKTRVKLLAEDGTIEIREYQYSVLQQPGMKPAEPSEILKPEESKTEMSVLPEIPEEKPVAEYIPPEIPGSDKPVGEKQNNRRRRNRNRHSGKKGQAPQDAGQQKAPQEKQGPETASGENGNAPKKNNRRRRRNHRPRSAGTEAAHNSEQKG